MQAQKPAPAQRGLALEPRSLRPSSITSGSAPATQASAALVRAPC
jgi:hypothetical protein